MFALATGFATTARTMMAHAHACSVTRRQTARNFVLVVWAMFATKTDSAMRMAATALQAHSEGIGLDGTAHSVLKAGMAQDVHSNVSLPVTACSVVVMVFATRLFFARATALS